MPKEDRSQFYNSKRNKNFRSFDQQKQIIKKNKIELPLSSKPQDINRSNRGIKLQLND